MSTRLDRPEGSGVEEREYPAANGAGASDGEPSGPERAGVTSSERRVEQEQSVHLERPQALPDEALPGAGGDASAVRPRWSRPVVPLISSPRRSEYCRTRCVGT